MRGPYWPYSSFVLFMQLPRLAKDFKTKYCSSLFDCGFYGLLRKNLGSVFGYETEPGIKCEWVLGNTVNSQLYQSVFTIFQQRTHEHSNLLLLRSYLPENKKRIDSVGYYSFLLVSSFFNTNARIRACLRQSASDFFHRCNGAILTACGLLFYEYLWQMIAILESNPLRLASFLASDVGYPLLSFCDRFLKTVLKIYLGTEKLFVW